MSLVEVQPSTLIELNELSTALWSRSASGPGSTAASVVRKASMVAMSGASMPAPLAMPATTKSRCLHQDLLRPRIGGEYAPGGSAAAAGEPERVSTSSGMPASMGCMGNGMPISPVEQTRIRSASTPRPEATRSHMRSASARPWAPVAALAFPLLTMTPATRPWAVARWSRLVRTGAAAARFEVKVAAVGTAWPSSVTRSTRSNAPLDLMPEATAAASNPRGVVMLTGTSPPVGVRWSRGVRRPGWQPGWPDRGPLDQVVDGGERQHPSGPRIDPDGDMGTVRSAGGLGGGGGVGDHHERLVVVGLVQHRHGPLGGGAVPGPDRTDGRNSGQDAAGHGGQVRGEQDRGAQVLLDLGGVAVVQQAVGHEVLVHRTEVETVLGARPAPDTPLAASMTSGGD